MLIAPHWEDYALIDAGDGDKIERWGKYVLRRPDPQAIWPMSAKTELHAHYHRAPSGGGQWEMLAQLPQSWRIGWQSLSFIVRPTGFKHTGLFPEQAGNWDWMQKLIRERAKSGAPVRILNLFGYTGAATCACASAGAEVVHVDAAKGMVAWAKDNLAACGLHDAKVRLLVDDAQAFVAREQRRGRQYEGILMDPPSYGRGPGGEMWKIEDALYALVRDCARLMSERPLFFLLNAYTTGLAPQVLETLLRLTLSGYKGCFEAHELGLRAQHRELVLPCGACGRWA